MVGDTRKDTVFPRNVDPQIYQNNKIKSMHKQPQTALQDLLFKVCTSFICAEKSFFW